MAKYSYEFKKKLVTKYLNGEASYETIANEYEVSDRSLLRRWVESYRAYGNEGLKRSREKKKYSFEIKMLVVQSYLTTEVSYQDLAIQFGINNPSLISRWVNDYRIAGADALRPKKKGRNPQVSKSKDQISQKAKENADSEYLKQLEDENLRLRIENAYLKELRRLRLEDEKKNSKRVLFTASEENSD